MSRKTLLKSPLLRLMLAFGVVIGMMAIGVIPGPEFAAASSPPRAGEPALELPAFPAANPAQGSRQIFSGDFRVERGQVINESVVVYSGNVDVEEGGRIAGALVVMSGNVRIARGAGVDGDVTAYSGDIRIDGRVGGSVSSMSGNIDLGNEARVEGDLSVLSGNVRRADGAYVGGNLVQTPGFRLPAMPSMPVTPGAATVSAPRTSLLAQMLGLLVRLVGAILLTALVAAIAGVIYSVWPARVAQVRTTLEDQRPLSFVVGLFGNLTLLFIIGLLSITVCLLPVALAPLLALLAVNLVGWTVASQIVGERVTQAVKQEVQPVLTIAVGAVLLTGIASLLWALGGCFRPIGFLFVLAVSSFGAGAVVVPWLNRRGAEVTPPPPVVTEEVPPAPVDDMEPQAVTTPPAAPEAPVATVDEVPVVSQAETVEPDVFEPVTEAIAEDEFTRMRGVGPAIEAKLKAAGIQSYAQLATATPEEIADILGWTVERVQRAELREQAARLAQGE